MREEKFSSFYENDVNHCYNCGGPVYSIDFRKISRDYPINYPIKTCEKCHTKLGEYLEDFPGIFPKKS